MATKRVKFTSDTITKAVCEVGKSARFYWDSEAPGLGLRVTPGGAKRYIFQAKVKGKRDVVRITLGVPGVTGLSIEDARSLARTHKATTSGKEDPRQLEADKLAAKQVARDAREAEKAAVSAQIARNSTTFEQVWNAYLAERKDIWGERHYKDHVSKFAAGGVPSIRGTRGRGVTIAGPLSYFAEMPLSSITNEIVEEWAKIEGKTRPTSARLAWRMLKVFFQWCYESKEYSDFLPRLNPGKTKKSRESLGKAKSKQDNIQTAQLPGWFDAVRKIGNLTISSYLQTLLLTGARPGEILEIKWHDVNWKWESIIIRDKIEGTRTIPLTPFVAHLLASLPRREGNEYVFSSAQKDVKIIGKPHLSHKMACEAAGMEGLTLHGLRRSFASLTAQMDIAGGVAMQIQGHKPTSVREKSYIVWPLDFLRKAHIKIEAEILKQAGVSFVPVEPGLRVVTAA